jgi:superfamily II DNA or RNA helicase
MSDERLQAAFDKTPDGILRKHVEFVGKDPDNWDDVQEVKGYAVNFMRAMGARKNVLYEAPEKIDVTCQLIEDFGDRNILTFAERTETANELYKRTSQYAVSYHSKMKPHIRKAALKAFPKTANVLHTSRALDEGFNVEGVNMGIVLSGTSTKRQAVQRVGRTIRFVEGKTAVFIELYIRSTQDRKWLEARQKGLKGVLILECFDYDDLVQRIKTYST